ncbi:signal peptidase I [Virgibacillus dakarensis]|uniref:Signal peptidase I n=1 Tax=Lentibacillus populi TaxID=1827502 RepID=A0A9W5TZA1_9BACI|nr:MULTISPECIES: signal peptidase I [Bacillaceae]MBT2215601.1 signal peptidase I [Virgibacillus dakarensis]MTW85228.1 signal peptidase I [Virgibacillus dakarensis]GGB48565.1 S26 family signal peptidase [Lentibacillus populi]
MKAKSILKLISNIVTTLLFIVLLVTLFAVISMKASGGEASIFGYQIKTVLSGSMEPDIQTGSIITIKSTDGQQTFQKGDVVTFKTEEDIFVTHRIVQVKEDGQHYITKGDANDAPDMDPVSPGDIVGVYTGFTVPYVGYVMNFANSREGAALMLVLPGVCLLLYSMVTIWRALRQIDKPKGDVGTDAK